MKQSSEPGSIPFEPLLAVAMAAVAVAGAMAAFSLSGKALTPQRRSGLWWLGAVTFLVAYWPTAILGLQWATVEGAGSPVWPAAGVGLAVLLIGGLRLWPMIFIGRLAAALATGSDQLWWAELSIALGSAGSTVLSAVFLMRWCPIDRRLTAVGDILNLALAAVTGAALAALVGVITLILSSGLGWRPAFELWVLWWLGTSVGMLVVTPLVLAWSFPPAWRLGIWRWLGLAALVATGGVLCYAIFFVPSLVFLRSWYVYPVLAWLAVAYQVRGVALGLLVVATAAVWSATIGTGPFTLAAETGPDRISLAQQFTAIAALTSLILAAAADQRRRIEALHRSEARENSIVNTAVDPIIVIDEQGRIVSFNPAAERTFGYRADEVLDENVAILMPEPHRFAHGSYMERYHRTGERRIIGIGRRVEGLRKDGTTFPLDLSVAEWRSGDSRFYTGIIHEQTERARAEEALRASEQRLATAIEASGGGVYEQCIPAREGLHVTPQWCQVLGYESLPVGPADFERWLLEQIHPDDRELRKTAFDSFINGVVPRHEVEVRKRHASGRWIWVRQYAQAIERDEDGKVRRLSGMMIDVTQRKTAERQVEHLARHDTLTGLPNRALFTERLAAATARSDAVGSRTGLVLIDLDHFKHVNDTMGHPAGDALLQIISKRLTASIRTGDTAARLGGDEFAVVLPDMGQSADVDDLARRICRTVVQPASIEGKAIEVAASFGIATYPDDADSVSLLMRNADLALYEAKVSGSDHVVAFNTGLAEVAVRRARVEAELRKAIERNELVLHYQPQFDLDTGRVRSVEALLRWPWNGALFPPDEFIPIAEASGLIRGLGAWVIGEASQQAARWRAEGYELKVAINVSPAEANTQEFIANLDAALESAGVAGDALELEIPEGLLIDPKKPGVRAFLNACQARGIDLAIDDFGIGYSSLGYLGRLPIAKVKIDRSFVSKIGHPDDDALMEAIVTLGHRLGKRVVAEGVETSSQLEFLRALGCDDAQGYFQHEPVEAVALGPVLQERSLPTGPCLRLPDQSPKPSGNELTARPLARRTLEARVPRTSR